MGTQTEVVDLEGKSLLPGFIDAHSHITLYGTDKLGVSCKEAHILSIDDVLIEIAKKTQETPIGQWVRAWGFNEAKIAEKRLIRIGSISADHPIIVKRAWWSYLCC